MATYDDSLHRLVRYAMSLLHRVEEGEYTAREAKKMLKHHADYVRFRAPGRLAETPAPDPPDPAPDASVAPGPMPPDPAEVLSPAEALEWSVYDHLSRFATCLIETQPDERWLLDNELAAMAAMVARAAELTHLCPVGDLHGHLSLAFWRRAWRERDISAHLEKLKQQAEVTHD